MRVPVIKRDDQAEVHLVICGVVQKAAALSTLVEWPPGGVDDQAFLVTLRLNLPNLLDTDAIMLRIGVLPQIELAHDLFTEVATHTLRKNRVLAQQLITRRIRALFLAILTDTHIAGGNAGDTPFGVIQNLGSSKSRKHVDAHGLGLFGQPLAKLPQADDVVTMIVHGTRQEQARHRRGTGCTREIVNPIALALGFHRSALLFPVRNQFVETAGLHNGPGKNMRPDLGAFFHHDDRQTLIELQQANRCGQSGRTATDNNDIELHRFAFRFFRHFPSAPVCGGRILTVAVAAIVVGM